MSYIRYPSSLRYFGRHRLYEHERAESGPTCTVKFNSRLDFLVLKPDERVVFVPVGVIIRQGLDGLGVTTLRKQSQYHGTRF
jgi:hypothetical protein